MPFYKPSPLRKFGENQRNYIRQLVALLSSQREAGKVMQLSETSVSYILSGKRLAGPFSLIRLAIALGIPPVDVLRDTGHEEFAHQLEDLFGGKAVKLPISQDAMAVAKRYDNLNQRQRKLFHLYLDTLK